MIGHVNKAIQYEELKIIIETTLSENKYKQSLSVYDIDGKEKTPRISEKKKRHVMVMFAFMNAASN